MVAVLDLPVADDQDVIDQDLRALGNPKDEIDRAQVVGEPRIEQHLRLLVTVVQIRLQQDVAVPLDLRPVVRVAAPHIDHLLQDRGGPRRRALERHPPDDRPHPLVDRNLDALLDRVVAGRRTAEGPDGPGRGETETVVLLLDGGKTRVDVPEDERLARRHADDGADQIVRHRLIPAHDDVADAIQRAARHAKDDGEPFLVAVARVRHRGVTVPERLQVPGDALVRVLQ